MRPKPPISNTNWPFSDFSSRNLVAGGKLQNQQESGPPSRVGYHSHLSAGRARVMTVGGTSESIQTAVILRSIA